MNTKTALVLAVSGALGACATTYDSAPRRPAEPPTPPQRVFFYPQQGQSPEQQDRDRYECYTWAVRETGFDPSRHPISVEQRQAAVPAPSGALTVGGAVAGAVLGAAVAGHGDAGAGAVIGGVAGGMLGHAAETSQAEAARRAAAERPRYRTNPRYADEVRDYRRAMSACLEGRGYSVR